MKKSELRQVIKEEIRKHITLKELDGMLKK